MKLAIKVNQSQTFYLVVIGNLIVLALAGLFVLRPVVGLLTKHTGEISQARAETASLTKKSAELKQLKETLPGYQSQYASALEGLPKTKDVAGYQTTLEDLAKLTGINLTLVDTSGSAQQGGKSGTTATQAPQMVGGFPVIPVRMEISGSYAQTLDFLQRLESMSRFTRVTGLGLSADTTGTLKTTINAQTLYFPNQTGQATAGGAS